MGNSETLSRLPIAGIIALIAAGVTALLWNPVPLEVPRPKTELSHWKGANLLQKMDARQWEDPLAVMDRFQRQHTKDGDTRAERGAAPRAALADICPELFPHEAAGNPSRLLVLGVMVSNSPYADVSEQRARMRQAVLSALHTGHFIPYDSQRLGLTWIPAQDDQDTMETPSEQGQQARAGTRKKAETKTEPKTESASRERELLVPFEAFERRPQPDAPPTLPAPSTASADTLRFKVVVLWLQEEWFVGAPGSVGAKPIGALSDLFERVTSTCPQRSRTAKESTDTGFPAKKAAARKSAARKSAARKSAARILPAKELTGHETLDEKRLLQYEVIDAAVIGPASSDGLRAMVLEAVSRRAPDTTAADTKSPDRRLVPVFYSALATSSAVDLLALNLKQTRIPCSNGARETKPWPTQDWRASYEANPRWTGSVLYWFFQRCEIHFLSTVSTDEELSHVLLEELKRRDPKGLGVEDDRYRVVLVHERDTYYGRTLPKAFVRAARKTKECTDDMFERDLFDAERLGGASQSGEKPCTIATFSYARGMDGQQPPVTREDKAAQQGGKEAAIRVAREEVAAGPRQFDHMRRLAAQIVEYERALVASDKRSWYRRFGRNGEIRIRAIGIVGSDVYDKLAVLRALREQFPDAVFFTTDLDARFIAIDQYEWTRNLVVASSFGLDLTPCLQRGIAPFRGSYQTSVYLAARLALHNVFPQLETGRARGCPSHPGDLSLPGHLAEPLPIEENRNPRIKLTQATVDAWLVTPRLFEIGRTQAFALLDSPRLQKNAVGNVHPGSDAFVPSNAATLASLIGFGVTAGGILLLPAPRRKLYDAWRFGCQAMMGCRGRIGWRVLAAGAILTVLVLDALLITAYLESMSGQGEPFLWVEGISTWPSELLRSAGLLITLGSIFAVLQVSERNLVRLQERFDFGPTDTPASWREFLRWRTRWQCRRRAGAKPQAKQNAGLNLRSIWMEHRALSSPECCMLRAALWMLLFWLVAYVMMELLGYPNLPARGQAMARLNQFLILTLVPAFLTLLFLVVELTARCSQLARKLDPTGPADDASPCLVMEEPVHQTGQDSSQPPVAPPSKKIWPRKSVENLLPRVVDYEKMDPHGSGILAVNAYMRAMLLAERSAAISPMVFYPLVILALLVMARARLFDGWNVPLGLIFVLVASFLVCCIVAWILHRTAERVRAQTIESLNTCLLECHQAAGSPPSAAGDANGYAKLTEEQIELLIKRIRELRIGAFRPAWEQPVVAAALLPLLSAGGLQLLQSLGVIGS